VLSVWESVSAGVSRHVGRQERKTKGVISLKHANALILGQYTRQATFFIHAVSQQKIMEAFRVWQGFISDNVRWVGEMRV